MGREGGTLLRSLAWPATTAVTLYQIFDLFFLHKRRVERDKMAMIANEGWKQSCYTIAQNIVSSKYNKEAQFVEVLLLFSKLVFNKLPMMINFIGAKCYWLIAKIILVKVRDS